MNYKINKKKLEEKLSEIPEGITERHTATAWAIKVLLMCLEPDEMRWTGNLVFPPHPKAKSSWEEDEPECVYCDKSKKKNYPGAINPACEEYLKNPPKTFDEHIDQYIYGEPGGVCPKCMALEDKGKEPASEEVKENPENLNTESHGKSSDECCDFCYELCEPNKLMSCGCHDQASGEEENRETKEASWIHNGEDIGLYKVNPQKASGEEAWQGLNCYNEQCGAHNLYHCPMCSHEPNSCGGCKKVASNQSGDSDISQEESSPKEEIVSGEKCMVYMPTYNDDGSEKDSDYWFVCGKPKPCPLHSQPTSEKPANKECCDIDVGEDGNKYHKPECPDNPANQSGRVEEIPSKTTCMNINDGYDIKNSQAKDMLYHIDRLEKQIKDFVDEGWDLTAERHEKARLEEKLKIYEDALDVIIALAAYKDPHKMIENEARKARKEGGEL